MNTLAWSILIVFFAAQVWTVVQVERFGAAVKKQELDTYEKLNRIKRGWAARYLVVYRDAEFQIESSELIAQAKRLRRRQFILFGLMPIVGLAMGYALYRS